MDKKLSMQKMYDDDINAFIGFDYSHMGYWAKENQQDFHAAQEESLRQLVQPLDLQAGQHILDVGGGQGSTAIWLCKNFDCHVTVVDIVPAMIEKAKEKVEQAGLADRITLICADILQFECGSQFDNVISVEAIHHIPDKPALFKKMNALLKARGRFAVSVYWASFHWRWLENLFLTFTVGDKDLCKNRAYKLAADDAGFLYVNERDISKQVLPKSSSLLNTEPYISKIKQYHRKHFGLIAVLLLPLFVLWGHNVIKANKLHLSIFNRKKK